MPNEETMLKVSQIIDLLLDVDFPQPFRQFFDIDSEKMLDEKIAVLQALKDGKQIADIPNFYDVLELMPKDGIWD